MQEQGQKYHAGKVGQLARDDPRTHALEQMVIDGQRDQRAERDGVKQRAARRGVAPHGDSVSVSFAC